MKREAYRHPKMYDLANRLGVSLATAIGTIQLLLNYAADVAPQGNIGKWTDGAISRGCEWPGPASEFVEALVESGWLDRCSKRRLVIHDLAEHAESWWKAKLQKSGIQFYTAETVFEPEAITEGICDPITEAITEGICDPITEAITDGITEGICEGNAPRDQTKPNQTKPNLSSPLASRSGDGESNPRINCIPNRTKPPNPDDFDKFFEIYPDKSDRHYAKIAWNVAAMQDDFDGGAVIGCLERQIAAGMLRPPPGRNHLLAKNWIERRKWEDPIPEKPGADADSHLENTRKALKAAGAIK
jgi:hypothetical protein